MSVSHHDRKIIIGLDVKNILPIFQLKNYAYVNMNCQLQTPNSLNVNKKESYWFMKKSWNLPLSWK